VRNLEDVGEKSSYHFAITTWISFLKPFQGLFLNPITVPGFAVFLANPGIKAIGKQNPERVSERTFALLLTKPPNASSSFQETQGVVFRRCKP
jgi:hypothetical protein